MHISLLGILKCQELQEPPTADLCQLIRLILSKNSLVFNNVNYLQVRSTAMGTRMAPSYANLFMGRLEHMFLGTRDKIPRVWWRYTDNIFGVWPHGEPALRAFIQNLNPHHPTIKFTAFGRPKKSPSSIRGSFWGMVWLALTCTSNPWTLTRETNET